MPDQEDDVADQKRAEMEAAFAESDGAKPVQAKTPEEPEKKVEQEEKPTATEPPVDELAILKAQVARIPELEKRLRDEGGRYGSLKQTIEQLQRRMQDAPKGDPVDVSAAMQKFKDAGYDELADLMAPLISGGHSKVNEEEIISKAEARLLEKQAAASEEAKSQAWKQLAEDHPDVSGIVARTESGEFMNQEYKSWLESLTPRQRRRVLTTENADTASDYLDEFKDWKKSKSASIEKANERNKSRVERAVTPSGSRQSTQSTISDHEAMLKAFAEADNM